MKEAKQQSKNWTGRKEEKYKTIELQIKKHK
jgi:hypothetical protein